MNELGCVLLCLATPLFLFVLMQLAGHWLYRWRFPDGYVPRAAQPDESLVSSDETWPLLQVPVTTLINNDMAEQERKVWSQAFVFQNEREGRVN